MVGGKWCFGFQFRRPLMITLMQIWDVMNAMVPVLRRLESIAEEILLALCLLPCMHQDLRLDVSSMVACSDASETGAGVCASADISELGPVRLGLSARGAGGGRAGGICLIETFGGISGGRHALELLAVTPACTVTSKRMRGRAAWQRQIVQMQRCLETLPRAPTRSLSSLLEWRRRLHTCCTPLGRLATT